MNATTTEAENSTTTGDPISLVEITPHAKEILLAEAAPHVKEIPLAEVAPHAEEIPPAEVALHAKEIPPAEAALHGREIPLAQDVAIAGPICENCGATINGHYCSQCGQHYEPHIHSLGHFMFEAAENLTHADSRVWLTLWPLLLKPGFLTKEFFEGRRSRYLPPFRLYLVISAIFFLLWAALPSSTKVYALSPHKGELIPMNEIAANKTDEENKKSGTTETAEQRSGRVCANASYNGPGEAWITPRVAEACRKVVIDNGQGFVHSFLANIPRSLFILLPGLAVLMKLMYWRPKRYYVEHLLFFIHNHAFVFLIMALYLLVSRAITLVAPTWPSWPLTALVWLYVIYYSYKSMRRFYGQGKWLTRLKFVTLSMAYLTGATTLLIFIAFFSFLTI